MRLSNRLILILKSVSVISAASILIVTLLLLVFLGKNLAFTTKFTPQSSQEYRLKYETHYTQIQALFMFISIINVLILLITTYCVFKHPQTAFGTMLISMVGGNLLALILNMNFLIGASDYRSYMNKQFEEIQNKGLCEQNRISLCMVGNCVRLQVYQQAKAMSIAYTVIVILFLTVFTVISILMNKKQKDSKKIQLIV